MKLSVFHETRYTHESPVLQAHHIAYLRPLDNEIQRLHTHGLYVSPAPEVVAHSVDRLGQHRTYFELSAPHDEMVVIAHSTLETTELAPELEGHMPELSMPPSLPWEDVVRHMQYEAGQAFDAAREYAQPSPLAPAHAQFADYAQDLIEAGLPVYQLAQRLCARIFKEFEYQPAATDVSTPPLQALELKQGVCQDFAQVMIAVLRSLGLAARYVSGYLLTQPPPGKPRLIGADASHAWASVYCPEAGWMEFDPTNNCIAGHSHVRLAYGRDYSDVAPLRGVIRGGGGHELKVAVTISPEGDTPLEALMPADIGLQNVAEPRE